MFAGWQPDPGPLQLPPNPVPAADMSCHFSLPARQRQQQPLKAEMLALTAWFTEPVQLDRQGGPVVPSTMDNLSRAIYQYLGFLYHFMGKSQATLQQFLDLHCYAAYMSFQRSKGNTYTTLSMLISFARKVAAYLKKSFVPGSMQAVGVEAALAWYNRLNNQLARVMPQASVRAELEELPSAREVVLLIEKLKQSALRSLPPLGQIMSFESARLLHDACLACLMFGYLPPIRLVCLRTLQLPTTAKCLVPGCLKPGCRGNRLGWLGGHLALYLNHYKVEKK